VITLKYKGKTITALSLRKIPSINGKIEAVKQNSRLDLIAQEKYNNPTKFWHIADANTELDPSKLYKHEKKRKYIKVPEK
jgi:hypothetical protein